MKSNLTSNHRRAALFSALFVVILPLFVISLVSASPPLQDDGLPQGEDMPGFTDFGGPVIPVFVDLSQAGPDNHPDSLTVGPPVVNLWYGDSQNFGQIGNPQPNINILGSVKSEAGRRITALSYSLNSGTEKPLSIGSDNRRLTNVGDFNIELEIADLNDGANQLVIKAKDNTGDTTQKIVTVNYDKGNTWPNNYTANWSSSSSILNTAQPVDGEWVITNNKLRTVTSAIGYDRAVAIGDLAWKDYEVTVPFTVHGLNPEGFKGPSNGPGIGLIMRWPGYYQEGSEQPRIGWRELGALGWHRWSLDQNQQVVSGLQMLGYGGSQIASNSNVQIEFGKSYTYKMSVQSASGKDIYRLKIWPSSMSEPSAWDMVGEVTNPSRTSNGSLMLLAHQVDAEFGNVVVKPTSSISPTLNVNSDGNGSVDWEPKKASYEYGDIVTLTASPGASNVLARWSGDLDRLIGRKNQIAVTLTQNNVNITAHFVPQNYGALTVNADPNKGSVTVSPVQTDYLVGELVTVQATAVDGFKFDKWLDDGSGSQNPYTFIFGENTGGNTTITAAFEAKTVFNLNLMSSPGGTILKQPVKPKYFENDVVKLTAQAEPGYKFTNWEGDLSGSVNPSYIAMTSNKSIKANFAEVGERFTLDVSWTGPGTVVVEPDKNDYAYGELVTLTAIPNDPDAYMLGSWGGDLAGNTSPITFSMKGNYNITASFVEVVDPRSDDFNRCLLENGRWTTVDKLGDATFNMTGTSLQISVPSGTIHELWSGTNNAPRVLTPTTNDDFTLDVKFDTTFEVLPSNEFQTQGIIVQESDNKLLRFDFFNDGDEVHVFAGTLENGTSSQKGNKIISNGSPLYMRVARIGNNWTQFYSYDGLTWTQAAKFSYTLNTTAAGLFIANPGLAPAFTAEFDYFFNAGAPIIPQDTNLNTLSVTTAGQGAVTVNPEKESYACGEQVQLTAVPAPEWNFAGWDGDLSGFSNPATLTITRSQSVVANFTTGEPVNGYRLYMPMSVGSKNN
jgi:regulation of enolase protein 1 (concanavalin A-like superfamily)